MEHKGNGAMTGTLLLAAGALIGAGAALLLAPKSGKDTRKDIARYAKHARRKAEGVVGEFTDSVSEMVDAVGDKAEDILDHGKDLTHEAKKELIGAIEEGRKKLERQRTKLEKMIA
ncbi:MAG: YtxH domain-containing protein [Deltaproteobacteria bacterium]|nr:YtxH domain-containing protein [Deltaproteobacteria bacterium]